MTQLYCTYAQYNQSMLTDPVAILQEIIDQDGSCEDLACATVCKRCPLGGKRLDGKRLSCDDYIRLHHNIDNMLREEVDTIYKTAAEEELFAIELEKLLE